MVPPELASRKAAGVPSRSAASPAAPAFSEFVVRLLEARRKGTGRRAQRSQDRARQSPVGQRVVPRQTGRRDRRAASPARPPRRRSSGPERRQQSQRKDGQSAAPATSAAICRARFSVASHFDNTGQEVTSPIERLTTGSSSSSAGSSVTAAGGAEVAGFGAPRRGHGCSHSLELGRRGRSTRSSTRRVPPAAQDDHDSGSRRLWAGAQGVAIAWTRCWCARDRRRQRCPRVPPLFGRLVPASRLRRRWFLQSVAVAVPEASRSTTCAIEQPRPVDLPQPREIEGVGSREHLALDLEVGRVASQLAADDLQAALGKPGLDDVGGRPTWRSPRACCSSCRTSRPTQGRGPP